MNTTTSTFPTNGTWLSRWHQIYTEVPMPVDGADDSAVTPLPRPSQFTTAA